MEDIYKAACTLFLVRIVFINTEPCRNDFRDKRRFYFKCPLSASHPNLSSSCLGIPLPLDGDHSSGTRDPSCSLSSGDHLSVALNCIASMGFLFLLWKGHSWMSNSSFAAIGSCLYCYFLKEALVWSLEFACRNSLEESRGYIRLENCWRFLDLDMFHETIGDSDG